MPIMAISTSPQSPSSGEYILNQSLPLNPSFSSDIRNNSPRYPKVDDFLTALNTLVSYDISSLILPSEYLFMAALYRNTPINSSHNFVITNIEVWNENGVAVFHVYPDPSRQNQYTITIHLNQTNDNRSPIILRNARLDKVAAGFEVVKRGRRLIGAGVGRILDGLTLAHDMSLILDLTASPSDFTVLPGVIRASNASFEDQVRRLREIGLKVHNPADLIDLCSLMRIFFISNILYLDPIATRYVSRHSSDVWLEYIVGRKNVCLFADICLPEDWNTDKVQHVIETAKGVEDEMRRKMLTGS